MMTTPALLLIDVIGSFFAPDGPNRWDGVEEVLDPLRRLLVTARDHDRLVVHAVERHRPGLADFEQPVLPVHCIAGEADAAYHPGFEPANRDREVEVGKRRYSAFFATDLALLLREQGVTDLVIGGVKTNVCIRSTIQDAFAHGFRVMLPRQATGSNRPHLAAASLEDVDRYFGRVVDLDEAVDAL